MRRLRSGQDTVLSWRAGAVECRVVAAAGQYVLLRPEQRLEDGKPEGPASLTYLDGMVPMGWDGDVEAGGHPGELRFRVSPEDRAADRRSSVRIPLVAAVRVVTAAGTTHSGQLLDVSAGGMRFRHTLALGPGDGVRVTCPLPDGMLVDADAVVRSIEVGIAAVEFLRMHGTDRDTIGRWTVDVLRTSLRPQG